MRRILSATAALCAMLCAPLLYAQAPQPAAAAAKDGADLRPVMPTGQAAINARVSELKAEAAALREGSRERGLKQIELGYALMAQGNDIDRRTGAAAAADALRIFDSARDPIPWAHGQALRAFFVDRANGLLANRAADSAAKAALTVFTKEAHPLQYVEVRCVQAMGKMLATTPDNSMIALSSSTFVALAPICGGLVFGDGQRESAGQLHATLRGFTFSVAALASQMGGAMTGLLALADGTGGAQALFRSGLLLDSFTGSRAAYLSGTMAMDDLGLAPADKARALGLRAQADAAAESSGRTGPAWRANRAVWSANAELFEILAAPRATMREPPPTPIPAIAPLMIDAQRGVVAFKGTRNQGGVIATQKGFSGGLLTSLARAGDSNASAAAVMSKAQESTASHAWMEAYGRGDFSASIAAFRAAFEEKWSPALRKAIADAGGRPGGRVLLLPDGPAGMLPIALLRDPATGRTLLEDYEVVMAPSVGVYNKALARAGQSRARALTLVALGEAESDLPFAAAETGMVESRFAGAQRPTAKADVLGALPQSSYWHFATHGGFVPEHPRASALLLAGGARLTLADLFQADRQLGSPRLVVLSACETGLFEATRDPDDFIGLPTGFLQAGAAGVIASLWPVSDASTALLMGKFYALHVGAGEAPPTALRHAQLWLKGADKAALSTFVGEEVARNGLTQARADLFLAEIAAATAAKPFEGPHFWGAFVYYGA